MFDLQRGCTGFLVILRRFVASHFFVLSRWFSFTNAVWTHDKNRVTTWDAATLDRWRRSDNTLIRLAHLEPHYTIFGYINIDRRDSNKTLVLLLFESVFWFFGLRYEWQSYTTAELGHDVMHRWYRRHQSSSLCRFQRQLLYGGCELLEHRRFTVTTVLH